MDISTAFTFVKNDKDWITKILITGLIGLIPIVGQLYLAGWSMDIAKRYTLGSADLLPDVNFGQYIKMGFKYCIVNLVYALPIIIVSVFTGLFTSVFMNSDSQGVQFFGAALSCGMTFIYFILGLAISVFAYAGIMRLIENGLWKDAFNFTEVWKMIKNSPKTFLLLLLLSLLVSLISSLGLVVCFIGVIFTTPYAMAVWGHLLGQAKVEIDKMQVISD
jgi:hypothetical protein